MNIKPTRKNILVAEIARQTVSSGGIIIEGARSINDHQMAKALVTNFHQPQSTLLFIIAAMLGDRWKSLYQTAIDQQYRFLSYGDGMLILM